MSGILNVGSFLTTEDSFSLDQLQDVSITLENHQNVLRFNDAITDPSFSDGFVGKPPVGIESVDDVNVLATSDHNSLFTFNDNLIDSSIVDGWTAKNVNDLLTGLQVTVEGLVNIDLSKRRGREGNPGLSDAVMFDDTLIGTDTFTAAIGSAGDNNIIYKRETTDEDFIFDRVMSKGEIANLNYPAGTIFRSTKGIAGVSSPFPLPLGLASLSDTYFRFFAFRFDVYVYATSAGLESTVTLFASDEITVVDGPTVVAPYQTIRLACTSGAVAEFVVVATNNVYCGTVASDAVGSTATINRDTRLVPPMSLELMAYNRFNRVTARETGTLVRWYRQNGETGIVTVNAGTPQAIYTGAINEEAGPNNAGSTVDYEEDGWLILKADKPISCFSGADGAGSNATPGWPLDQLAQLFPNPANIDDQLRADQASISIASPYEGSAFIYDSTGALLATIALTRAVAVTTAADQLYPASAQWQPIDQTLPLLPNYLGGWVETNVPAFCVMNFRGGTAFPSDNGDETAIPGTTPEEIRAVIKKDASGIFRRRDIDAGGIETWNVC